MLAQQAPPAPAPPAPAPTAPAPPARPQIEHTIDNMLSISVFYWRPDHGHPQYEPGTLSTSTVSQHLDLPTASRATGAVITFPTKGFNRLELGYWQTYASGSTPAPEPLNLFGANLKKGDLIATNYKIRNIRLTWNYLTYPVPAFDAKLRIKTFWEAQYTHVVPYSSFPESSDPTATVGNKQSVIWPGAGIGFEYVPSKRFRMEGHLSGMAFPGRSRYADAEVTLVGTIGHVEIFGGGKAFHFRTSPKVPDSYIEATILGPMAGIRWVFK